MPDFDPSTEVPLHQTTGRSPWPALVILVAGLAAAGGYYGLSQSRAPVPPLPMAPALEPAPDPPTAAPVAAPVAEPETPDQRPNESTAARIRRLGGESSSSHTIARWLSSEGVFQRIAAATRMVAEGRSPRGPLSFIRIPGSFKYREVGSGDSERTFIDSRTYRRYDAVARAFSSVNPKVCGRAYRQMRPRFSKLYRQIAGPGETFDGVVAAAVGRLVGVRVPKGPIELTPRGAIFLYADPKLEALSQAEKHVVRMGPDNAKTVQQALRACATNAGLHLTN